MGERSPSTTVARPRDRPVTLGNASVRHARSCRESATRALLPRFVACPYAACLPMNTVHSIATTRCFLEPNGAHHEPHFPDPLPNRIGRDGSGCEPLIRDHRGCRAGDVRLCHTRCGDHVADRAGACDDHCSEVGLTLRLASLLSRWCAPREAASNLLRHRARTCPYFQTIGICRFVGRFSGSSKPRSSPFLAPQNSMPMRGPHSRFGRAGFTELPQLVSR